MGISAKIVADSIAAEVQEGKLVTVGRRLITFQLRYPRFIHAELMTHRVFSRNASSSRAIPVLTMLKEIINDPAMPVYWGANERGMQAKQELTGFRRWAAEKIWRAARYPAVALAYAAYKIGLHKQLANRICEPWAHINVLVSATEYQNWFNLRTHEDAQPEIRELANLMDLARWVNSPKRLLPGQFHLPYVSDAERNTYGPENSLKVSVARCARVSYLTHDQKAPEFEKDLALYDRLVGSTPLHASPAEHQATPDPFNEYPDLHGNFVGWIQHRKTLPNEFEAG